MDNKELKIQNAAELLVSFRKNLNEVSKELSLKYEEKELLGNEISNLEKKKLEELQNLDKVKKSTAKIFTEIDNSRKKLDLEREKLNQEHQEHLNKLAEIDKKIDIEDGRYENLLIEINELHKTLIQLQDKEKEFEGIKISIVENKKILTQVDRNINNKRNELDEINKQIREAREKGLKELEEIDKQKEIAQESLETAIRAQDPIKDNIKKQQEKLDNDKKDFQILVGRLRKLYQAIGQDIKL